MERKARREKKVAAASAKAKKAEKTVKVTAKTLPPESSFPGHLEMYREWKREWELGKCYPKFRVSRSMDPDMLPGVIEFEIGHLLASAADELKRPAKLNCEALAPEKKQRVQEKSRRPLRDNPYPRPNLDTMTVEEWYLWSEAEAARYIPQEVIPLTADNLPPETEKSLVGFLDEYRVRKEQWATAKCYPSVTVSHQYIDEEMRQGAIIGFIVKDLVALRLERRIRAMMHGKAPSELVTREERKTSDEKFGGTVAA